MPGYLSLSEAQLGERVERAQELLAPCVVCPRECRVDRHADELGVCRTGSRAMVSSFNPHFGEERPLVGHGGSGTIFLTHCNLKCAFCQNYEISEMGDGELVGPGELSSVMLYLQKAGCENINFVSPTHVVPQILEALARAVPRGLHLPLVYNTGGYDSVGTLELLDGIVDIYMPDMKYSSSESGEKLSGVPDYAKINREAVREMHRQVGDLKIGESGVAERGLLVRHLVLPGGLSGTEETSRFLAEEISKDTYINIMDQYRPCFRSKEFPEINRKITDEEYREALHIASRNGLHRFDRPAKQQFFRM